MNKENLKELRVPEVFSSRGLAELTTVSLRAEKMTLSELEAEKLHKINQVLSHPELSTLIDEGKITLGMIKPRADESKNLSLDDAVAADLLAEEIGEENIVFSLPLKLSSKDAAEFYAGNPYLDKIQKHFKKGAATFILIYREEGDAVSWWRKRMGSTMPEKAEAGTIRKEHALSIANNLVHGSDSLESVKKELGILKKITQEIEEKSERTKEIFPHESCIGDLVLGPGEKLLALEKNCPLKTSLLPDLLAIVQTEKGTVIRKKLLVKNLAKAS